MRIIIVHLSDIHFLKGENQISARTKSIVSAVSSQTPGLNAALIAVSGDIAFSGSKEEYAVASAFFSELEEGIRALNKDVETAIVSVPGNHDCFLPESRSALRKALISGIGSSVETGSPDPEILSELLSVQTNYWDFQGNLTSLPKNDNKRLCSAELIVLRGTKIQVNLYNTALLSQRNDSQTLKVPFAVFDYSISPMDDVYLTIAVLHHTYLWLESNNSIQFRRHLEENSEIILSGHQHIDHAFEKLSLDGQHTLYLEGTALQDSSNSKASGFNVVEIDIPDRKQRIIHFDWERDSYKPTIKRDWSPIVHNPAFRHDFRASDNFQRFLSDPGAGYTHSRKREITLRDIYVYPDLSVRPTLTKPTTVEVGPEQFHDFLKSANHVIFEGEGQSGRTALAKIMFSDLLNVHGFVPLFVEGSTLKRISEDQFAGIITTAVKDQYGADREQRFLQLDISKRVLIVDDWHRANLSSETRSQFLEMANLRFRKVFLFSDPIFNVQEFVTKAKDQSSILRFQHATIRQFGYKTRARLITKWLTLGREHSYDPQELTREIDQIENVVTTLLGKNTLPKFPFIVLSVLQAYQEKKAATAEAGSYGYVYEVLITTALASTAKSPSDIDKKYTFLAHLAYRMFKLNTESLAYAEIVGISQEYFQTYGLAVTTDNMLDDLVVARVLALRGGNYQFSYSYYFEYFVARYYKDAMQTGDPRSPELAAELSDMAHHINWEQYSKILMFFLYFTRNPNLIALLISNSEEIFKEYSAVTLEGDIEFADGLWKGSVDALIPAGDVHANREERNRQRDEMDRSAAKSVEGKKIKYSQTLDPAEKLDIARHHLELLGQILRNFPGSLRADAKLKIARCTYLLGLRVVSAILDLLNNAIAHYRDLFTTSLNEETAEETKEGITEIKDLVDKLLVVLTRLGVFGLIKKISLDVGSPELDQTYMDVLGNLPDTNAVKLIDLAIRLDHFPGFPESKIRQLDARIKKNSFVYQILIDLVVDHLLFFEVDYKLRQRVGSLLGFKDSAPKILDQRTKLLRRPPEKKT